MRLIDADDFREILEVIRQEYREGDTLSSGFAACVIETVQDEYLALAPTVDAVEVVHGRWSPVTYGLGVTVTRWMCSNCKKYENSYGRTNYCPNCGAKMDGGE